VDTVTEKDHGRYHQRCSICYVHRTVSLVRNSTDAA
jgi:hypothetical protein